MSSRETQIIAFDESAIQGFSQMLADLMAHLLERLLPQSYQAGGQFFLDDEALEHLAPLTKGQSLWEVEPSSRISPWQILKHIRRFHKQWPMSGKDRNRLITHILEGWLLDKGNGEKCQRENRKYISRLHHSKPKSELESAHWSLLMGDALKVHLEGDTPRFPPQPFWTCLAEQAWGDGNFQMNSLKILRQFFLERVLLDPQERVFPPINRQTYWALLALVTLEPGNERKNKVLEVCLRDLNKIAARMALSKLQWAEFWDRWLLRRAMTLRPNDAPWPGDTFRKAMEAMPLELEPEHRESEEKKDEDVSKEPETGESGEPPPLPLAKPHHTDRPTWLEELKDL